MNSSMYQLYTDAQMAEQVRAKLVAAGIKRRDIQVLAVPPSEREHVGSFADTEMHMHTPERDHVGNFVDTAMHTPESEHVGGFADTEMHMHTPEHDHVGSFATHMHADDIVRELERAGVVVNDTQSLMMQVARGATVLVVRPAQPQAAMVADMLRA